MRRGFKAKAERLAVAVRGEIGQDARERLDIPRLRDHLSVQLTQLGDLVERCPDAVNHLHGAGLADFSAALIIGTSGRLIVINERHSPARLANSVAHELSHVLLDHEATPGFDLLGNRDWRQDDEEEADWLAGCLLAPRSGLIAVLGPLGHDLARGAAHYGISLELMRQRWHQTGAAVQVARRQRR
jgi:hypothetical protein